MNQKKRNSIRNDAEEEDVWIDAEPSYYSDNTSESKKANHHIAKIAFVALARLYGGLWRLSFVHASGLLGYRASVSHSIYSTNNAKDVFGVK